MKVSALSFEKTLQTEVSKLHVETAELRSEMVAMKAELKSEFKSDIAILHRDNVVMTRWMLVAVLGGATLFPIVDKILNRLF